MCTIKLIRDYFVRLYLRARFAIILRKDEDYQREKRNLYKEFDDAYEVLYMKYLDKHVVNERLV